MANIMFAPKFHVDDSTGAPLASGKVYFYSAGTSTPKDTYSAASAAPGTENANPVILDSRGEATVYGVGSYKVVVKDSNDATIYTVDNYKISGTVDTADITDGAVTTAKLATNALSADVTGRSKMQDGFVTSAKLDTAGVALPNASTANTQTTGDNTTKVATTAFVQGEFTDKTASQADQETGTSTTKFVTSGRQKYNPLHAKAVGYIDTTTPRSPSVGGGSTGISSASSGSTGKFRVTLSDTYNYLFPSVQVKITASGVKMVPNITATSSTYFDIEIDGTGGSLQDPTQGFYVFVFGDL